MKPCVAESNGFQQLRDQLGLGKRDAMGTLSLLWSGTALNAPNGDIGKFTNEEIAEMCEWKGDPTLLVQALVDCGWLNDDASARLVVHDWASKHRGEYL